MRVPSKAFHFILILLFTTSCAKKDFTSGSGGSIPSVTGQGVSGGNPSATGNGQSCDLQTLTVPIKVLFVVDVSGSNYVSTSNRGTSSCPKNGIGCAPATDPQKTFRYGSISAFFNTVQAKTNFSWGFETFSDSPSTLINGFGSSALMSSALTSFNNGPSNGGGTDYLSALSSAQSMIANDPDLKSSSGTPTLYRIIFLSDGYPTDALNPDGSVDMTSLNSAIASIIALAPSQIQLSTVYYGTINDPTAAATLQGMATAGGGQFVNADTSSTSTISINDLITIGSAQCK